MAFLLPIFGFFMKNPLGQKIGIALLCLTVGGVALRWYGNKQYYQGRDQGIRQGAEDLRKSQEASWKAREEAIDQEKQRVLLQGQELEKRGAELVSLRTSLDATLAKIRSSSSSHATEAIGIVSSIPGDQLDEAIRAKSKGLSGRR